MRKEQEIDWKINCFTVLRYVATLEVLIAHCITHFEIDKESLFCKVFSYSIGMFSGVPVFFDLSGYLIWASLSKQPKLADYALKRSIRIYPELWLAVVCSLLSIILLYRQFLLLDLGLFAITQSTFLQFWTPDSLRGFGCGTLNGSLWTICIFVQFYVAAWLLHSIINKSIRSDCSDRMKYETPLIFCVWGGVLTVLLSVGYKSMNTLFSGGTESIMYKLLGQTIFPYLSMFFAVYCVLSFERCFSHC